VRGPVGLTDVCLDLDDAAGPAPEARSGTEVGDRISHEERAEESPRRLERRRREQLAVERGQPT
jgi:hypothetical protein